MQPELDPDLENIESNLKLSDEEYAEALRDCAALAQGVLSARPLSYVPTLVIYGLEIDNQNGAATPKREVLPMPDFDIDRRRTLLARLAYERGKSHQVLRAVFFISEAWSSKYKPDEAKRAPMPALDPQKAEIVMVMGCTLDGRGATAHIPITRNQHQRMLAGPTTFTYDGSDAKLQPTLLYQFLKNYQLGVLAMLKEAGYPFPEST